MDEVFDNIMAFIEEMAADINNIPEAEFEMIIQILQEMIEILAEAEQGQEGEGIPVGTTPASEIPSGPYPSSNVEGFQYDPKSGKLQVQFHGPYPQAKGNIYEYDDVPQYIYDIFSRGAVGPKSSGKNRYHEWIKGVTPSLGGSLNALLKGGKFNYRRVS